MGAIPAVGLAVAADLTRDRGGSAAELAYLEHLVERATSLPKYRDQRASESEVTGTAARLIAPESVDSAHDLRVDSDAGLEGEAIAVDAAERDPPHPLLG